MKVASRASRKILLSAIHIYQGVRVGHLSPCRFTPSCSEYAAEAIALHGSLRGTALAMKRIARCNPLGGRGFDPVAG